MIRVLVLILLVVSCGVTGSPVQAHEIRPAYLQIDQVGTDRYDVIWRTPLNAGMRLPVVLSFPVGTRDVGEPMTLIRSDSVVERRKVQLTGGLEGKSIALVGLEGTITDALVRVSFQDGRQMTEIVRSSRPYVYIAKSQGWTDVARVYMVEGMEHILYGFDHLLFIFGLMLLVQNKWMLVKTITAFTVAHSITLAAATYGIVHVPAAPLEAAIAASIMFLGVEVLKERRGDRGLAGQCPWLVAFSFGLLHGIGFASGLSLIGLPPAAVPLALVSFNCGVEIGQLVFVTVILGSAWSLSRVTIRWPSLVSNVPVYLVGGLGAYWMIERVSSIFSS